MKKEQISSFLYKCKLWFGFKFLNWYKQPGYDYGYREDKYTVVYKRRDEDGKIHQWKIFNIA